METRNKSNRGLGRLFLLITGLILVSLIFYIFTSFATNTNNYLQTQNTLETTPVTLISSLYPENTPSAFVYPPPTIPGLTEPYDPYKYLAQGDQDMASWLNTEKSRPGVRLIHGDIVPLPEMNLSVAKISSPQPYSTVSLATKGPFKGLIELLPYYSTDDSEPQTFIITALLDGQQIQLGKIGESLKPGIVLQLKSGEKSLFEFETEAIPLGVHNLELLSFDFAANANTVPISQLSPTKVRLRDYPYKVFVGAGTSQVKIDWKDWSSGENPFPRLDDFMDIIDVEKSKQEIAFTPWQPEIYQPGQKITFPIAMTANSIKGEREYCMVAFLNYNVIPIQDGKNQICGILKDGQWGVVSGSFKAPDKPGNYLLEIVRVENPLVKESYVSARPQERITPVQVSRQFLIQVQDKS